MVKKAPQMLRDNIGGLLAERRYQQADLAQWCGHSGAWLSAFLSGKRDLPLKDLDRIADFFGLVTYQLFQPGVARSTERRGGRDRRSGPERRVSAVTRNMQVVAAEIDRRRPPRRNASDHPKKSYEA